MLCMLSLVATLCTWGRLIEFIWQINDWFYLSRYFLTGTLILTGLQPIFIVACQTFASWAADLSHSHQWVTLKSFGVQNNYFFYSHLLIFSRSAHCESYPLPWFLVSHDTYILAKGRHHTYPYQQGQCQHIVWHSRSPGGNQTWGPGV